MKSFFKIISLIILAIIILLLIIVYISLDNSIPKLKSSKIDLTNWNYKVLEEIKIKRKVVDSLINKHSYNQSANILKSIIGSKNESVTDYLTLSKIYAIKHQSDSLYKYFKIYTECRKKTSEYLLWPSYNMSLDGISEFRYYKNDEKFSKIKLSLDSCIKVNERNFNKSLINDLTKMLSADQAARNNEIELSTLMIDSINQIKLSNIITAGGMPTISTVGILGISSVFTIIQHSNDSYMEKYFPVIQKLTISGEFPKYLFAYLVDRHNMFKGLPQIFGTQIVMASPFSIFTKKMKLYDIAEPNYVEIRRSTYGLNSLMEYKKEIKLQ